MKMNLPRNLRARRRIAVNLAAACLCSSLGFSGLVWAAGKKPDDDWVGKNNFGGTGLFQTRSARLGPDGMFEAGYSRWDDYKRYYLTIQGLPWLEGTFRYTEVRNRLFSPFASFSGSQTFKDRGADLSIRLLEEGKYKPALAVTLQDGLGTGQFSGEYLTANKRFYDLDFSLGMNWGYGTSGSNISNPLTYLSSKLGSRTNDAQTGGKLNFETYFSGENVALFGGVAYRTPVKNLTFKFEYDPNDYQLEPQGNQYDKNSPFNFGFMYRPFPWLETSLSHERGNITSFRVALRSNLHDSGMPKYDDPPPPALKSRAEVEGDLQKEKDKERWPKWLWPSDDDVATTEDVDEQTTELHTGSESVSKGGDVATKLVQDLARQSLEITDFEIVGDEVRVSLTELERDQASSKLEDAAMIIEDAFPDNSEVVTISTDNIDQPANEIKIQKGELENPRIVDHMFEALETEGFQVEGVTLTHTLAEVAISRIRKSAQPSAKVARVVLRSVPTPVEAISLVLVNSGHKIARHDFARSEIERDAFVDEMFDALGEKGFTVGEINFSHRSAVLELELTERSKVPDFSETARTVADTAPTSLDQITLVVMQSGIEIARATADRTNDANGGGEWNTAASGEGNAEPAPEPHWTEADKIAISRHLFGALSQAKFYTEAVVVKGRSVAVYGGSRQFRQRAKNLGRVLRVLANNVPPEIERLTIVTTASGMEMSRITIQRADLENAVSGNGSVEEIWANAVFEGPRAGIFLPNDAVSNPTNFPNVSWTINPKLRTHAGGPEQFVLYRIFATAGFDAALWRGLSVTGRINRNIYDNFDKIEFGSSSVLPHVRTDIKEYLQEAGFFTIFRLQANYYFAPVREWYARVSAGIFEQMFGGYSMEVLHHPHNSRFAIGVDVNKVWKREFDQLLKFRDYNVITGHLNAYYDSPWYDVSLSAHVGRFLAGDTGVSFVASRTFDSGVRVGLWATLTDVPSEVFGEGSFDKGFYISLPFELFLTESSTRRGTFAFRPITRDGGARLGMEGRLHGIVSGTGTRNTMKHWNKFLE